MKKTLTLPALLLLTGVSYADPITIRFDGKVTTSSLEAIAGPDSFVSWTVSYDPNDPKKAGTAEYFLGTFEQLTLGDRVLDAKRSAFWWVDQDAFYVNGAIVGQPAYDFGAIRPMYFNWSGRWTGETLDSAFGSLEFCRATAYGCGAPAGSIKMQAQTVTQASVPEPSTVMLLGLGILGMARYLRRRRA